MSGDLLGWTIAILFVLFWAFPLALLIWVIWEVARRLSRRQEAGGTH